MIEELRSLLGERLSTASDVRESHGKDISYHTPAPPDAVAFPLSTDEVSRIVRICAQHETPMIPFGAGTSVEGQVTAPHGGVSIDLSRMNRILEVHEADMDAVVQPGVTRQQLDRHLEQAGLFFPVDPGAEATLGGMASTRASGSNAVRYGTMRENVLGLEVVLPDGRVVKTGGRARKSSAGFDLTRLFVGAEGTLGVITALELRLQPVPEAISSAVCPFPSLESAVNSVIRTIRCGIAVARVELLDEVTMRAVGRYSKLDYPEVPTLFFEFHGSRQAVAEQAQAVEAIATEFGGEAFRWAVDPEERRRLWQARHEAFYAIEASRPGAQAVISDVCVPISRLAECILQTKQDLAEAPVPTPLFGHVGDGNFHLVFLIDLDDPQERETVKRINHRLVTRALALDGTCTGEHGIGVGKPGFLVEEHGEAVEVMRTIKQAIDPHNLMNPGKMF